MKQLLAFLASLFTGKKKKPPVIIVPPVIVPAYKLVWPDRRPIGQIMIAEYTEPYKPGKKNWKLGGQYQFSREALMLHAAECIKNMKAVNAQGMVTWNIEAEEYPKSISYIGDPRLVPPEMEPYIDDYFALFTNNGFRTGVCLRPNRFVKTIDWAAQFSVISPLADLVSKIEYAKKRWGCTLFYVDSNVGVGIAPDIDNTAGYGQLLPASIFAELAKMFPDCLIMPEHQDAEYYLYTAPYNDKNYRPLLNADEVGFQVLTVDGWSVEQLRESVKQGNVLMFRPWYNGPDIQLVKQAYIDAGQQSIKD